MNESKDPPSRGFTPMNTNDRETQHYLQMTDEMIMEQQQKTGGSGAGAGNAFEVLTSEATYEGDDELDESVTSRADSPSDEKPKARNQETQNLDLESTQDRQLPTEKEGATDFVHVHLEHLPSQEEIQEQQKTGGQFFFYRKLAAEGSPHNTEKGNISSNLSTTSERARLAAKDWELPKLPTSSNQQRAASPRNASQRQQAIQGTIEQQSLAGATNETYSVAASQRQQALQGQLQQQLQQNRQANIAFNRQQALQGNLSIGTNNWNQIQKAQSSNDDTIKEHILQQEDFDFVTMEMASSTEESNIQKQSTKEGSLQTSRSSTEEKLEKADSYKKDVTDACSTTESNLDDTSIGGQGSRNTSNQSPQCTPKYNNDKETTRSNANRAMADSSQQKYNEIKTVHGRTPDDESVSQSETFTSEGDYSWKQRRYNERKERLLQRRDEKIRMSLTQTLQHNTRANFCGIFLLCVALATLVLLLVAKWWTSGSNSESMFYDEDEDQNFVVTNNDQLLTVEVLTFALILVLLLGSMCYLGAVSCQANESLIRTVKHEDACLANSSARRKHPHYRAPYVEGSPSRRYGTSDQDPCGRKYTRDNGDQQSCTSYTDMYGNFQQNQTFSMISSESVSEYMGRKDEILISMEEAGRYYRDLQEEDTGMCCSPMPYENSPSAEEPTDYSAA